jgi:hypothetical protein
MTGKCKHVSNGTASDTTRSTKKKINVHFCLAKNKWLLIRRGSKECHHCIGIRGTFAYNPSDIMRGENAGSSKPADKTVRK